MLSDYLTGIGNSNPLGMVPSLGYEYMVRQRQMQMQSQASAMICDRLWESIGAETDNENKVQININEKLLLLIED